jgi:hypothetical protein
MAAAPQRPLREGDPANVQLIVIQTFQSASAEDELRTHIEDRDNKQKGRES